VYYSAVFRKLRQEDHEFEASLHYIMRTCHPPQKNKKKRSKEEKIYYGFPI
jgi:hypothetical protein